MSEINNIPNIEVNGTGIPLIPIQNTGIQFIGTRPIFNANVREVKIRENRVWLIEPPNAIPIAVPVTERIGTPVVDMPGCVKISKENNTKPEGNKNKMLVDDDPKGNVVLCDAGAPYYEPPEYDYRDLTWQTITQEQPEAGGVDTGEAPPTDIDTPQPPVTPPTGDEEVECPPINARRIGDLNAKGDERVKEYKLTPDGKICETIWEPVPTIEQFLPSIPTVTTTASIAAVATTSALLAKPLADLLLKVVKPVVKKVIAKVQKILGKTPYRPTLSEIQTNQYREKKGMLPLKFGKKKVVSK
tara:strand:- start:3575 stop:4477 length:903 start_codon:yes stop_codon:yes gene_type:complete